MRPYQRNVHLLASVRTHTLRKVTFCMALELREWLVKNFHSSNLELRICIPKSWTYFTKSIYLRSRKIPQAQWAKMTLPYIKISVGKLALVEEKRWRSTEKANGWHTLSSNIMSIVVFFFLLATGDWLNGLWGYSGSKNCLLSLEEVATYLISGTGGGVPGPSQKPLFCSRDD